LPEHADRTRFLSEPRPTTARIGLSEDDLWLEGRAAFESNPANRVVFDPVPHRWHPALRAHRDRIRSLAREAEVSRRAAERYERLSPPAKARVFDSAHWTWQSIERSGGVFTAHHKAAPFRLSLLTSERALAVANVFALAAEERGFRVADDANAGRFVVEGHGGRVPIRLTERQERRRQAETGRGGTRHEETIRACTGELRLHLEFGLSGGLEYSDKQGLPLEARLNEALVGLCRLVVRCREERRANEARECERAEAHSRWLVAEKARQDEEKRQAEETRRRKELLAEAERWQTAQTVRSYLDEVKNRLSLDRALAASGVVPEWLSWADQVAKELDPLPHRLASMTDVAVAGTDG
jgi:hypothetical protein